MRYNNVLRDRILEKNETCPVCGCSQGDRCQMRTGGKRNLMLLLGSYGPCHEGAFVSLRESAARLERIASGEDTDPAAKLRLVPCWTHRQAVCSACAVEMDRALATIAEEEGAGTEGFDDPETGMVDLHLTIRNIKGAYDCYPDATPEIPRFRDMRHYLELLREPLSVVISGDVPFTHDE